MRFALLGDHPDGLDLARALVDSGRHELACYSGPAEGSDGLQRRGLTARSVGDVEEVLADPAIEAVVVAGRPAVRAAQLRRALQSERHVLCVYPPDQTPDLAYEAALIQGDTGRLLLPILTERFHPAVATLARLTQTDKGPLGRVLLIEVERRLAGLLMAVAAGPASLTVPCWDVLRRLRGEIAEVSAFASAEEPAPDEPVLLAGRFERGGLFQATLLPGQHEVGGRLAVVGTDGQAELTFPEGWLGPAKLSWPEDGIRREEAWNAWNPGPALVEDFEAALAEHSPPGARSGEGRRLSWQDAVRSLELDDAARRSIARRRASTLEYQEATEEVGFKGTMTLVGCALLWAIIVLAILSAPFPKVGWLILPVLVVFLGLQLFRWVIPQVRKRPPTG